MTAQPRTSESSIMETQSSRDLAGLADQVAALAINADQGNAGTQPVFTLFPDLPLEIRRKIWKAACCVSRFVDIWANPTGLSANRGNLHPWSTRFQLYRLKSKSTIPAILHTSHEARSTGLEHYKLSFASAVVRNTSGTPVKIGCPPQIYFHRGWDIACPMEIVNRGPKDDITFFVGNVLRACEKDRLVDRIALDVHDRYCHAWGMALAWNEKAGCEEVLLYSGSTILLRTTRVRGWPSIRIPLEKISVEDFAAAASFDAASIDGRIKEDIASFISTLLVCKTLRQEKGNLKGQDPIVKFMMLPNSGV